MSRESNRVASSLPLAADANSASPPLSRRSLLCLGCSAAVLSACGNGSNPDAGMDVPQVDSEPLDIQYTDVPPDGPTCTGTDAGPLSDFPMGVQRLLPDLRGRPIISRDEFGLWAMFGQCTHFSGLLEPASGGRWHCTEQPTASHDSYFDANGRPLTGPAASEEVRVMMNRPYLAQYQVELCGDRVVYYVGRRVPLGTRTRVP